MTNKIKEVIIEANEYTTEDDNRIYVYDLKTKKLLISFAKNLGYRLPEQEHIANLKDTIKQKKKDAKKQSQQEKKVKITGETKGEIQDSINSLIESGKLKKGLSFSEFGNANMDGNRYWYIYIDICYPEQQEKKQKNKKQKPSQQEKQQEVICNIKGTDLSYKDLINTFTVADIIQQDKLLQEFHAIHERKLRN